MLMYPHQTLVSDRHQRRNREQRVPECAFQYESNATGISFLSCREVLPPDTPKMANFRRASLLLPVIVGKLARAQPFWRFLGAILPDKIES